MSSRTHGLPLFGFAAGGLLLGHLVSYLLAVPDPHHREAILRQTGHGYLPAAGEVALILALAGIATLVARSWSGRGRRENVGFVSLAAGLAAIQVAAFSGQEVLERLVAGAPLGGLLQEHLLLIGVVVQVAVAVAGAGVLRSLSRATARLANVVAVRVALPRPIPVFAIPIDPDPPGIRVAAPARSVRGPPSS